MCPHPRNLTDDQIRQMVSRRCLIGLNYYTRFLREDGQPELGDLMRHIDHFLALGAENCLALGSDFDGADLPQFLSSPTKAAGLYGELAERYGTVFSFSKKRRKCSLPSPTPPFSFLYCGNSKSTRAFGGKMVRGTVL